MGFKPLVSIVIPVYNGANYLKEAIDSALIQTYDNIEVLVINDGSDDNGETEEIALSYGNEILYIYKDNGGVSTALNTGITEMSGEYFSWLSHDDVYTPEKIETQINHLCKLENKHDVIFSGWIVIDSVGHEVNRILPLEQYEKQDLELPLFPLLNGMISSCSLLVHKSHFERVGNFNENLPTTQDYDLWFRLMRGQHCRVSEGALHKTRVHNLQGSRVCRKVHAKESSALWIKMMNALTESEMIQLGGSVPEFYKQIYILLLKYTNSKFAMRYARRRAVTKRGILGFFQYINLSAFSVLAVGRLVLSLKRRHSWKFR